MREVKIRLCRVRISAEYECCVLRQHSRTPGNPMQFYVHDITVVIMRFTQPHSVPVNRNTAGYHISSLFRHPSRSRVRKRNQLLTGPNIVGKPILFLRYRSICFKQRCNLFEIQTRPAFHPLSQYSNVYSYISVYTTFNSILTAIENGFPVSCWGSSKKLSN